MKSSLGVFKGGNNATFTGKDGIGGECSQTVWTSRRMFQPNILQQLQCLLQCLDLLAEGESYLVQTEGRIGIEGRTGHGRDTCFVDESQGMRNVSRTRQEHLIHRTVKHRCPGSIAPTPGWSVPAPSRLPARQARIRSWHRRFCCLSLHTGDGTRRSRFACMNPGCSRSRRY